MAEEEVRIGAPLLQMKGVVTISPTPQVQRYGDRRLRSLSAYNLLLKI
jgi:hypothetical protein